MFELGLVLWPKSLKDTWIDGKTAILAQIRGDAAKYAPEAFDRTAGKLPAEPYPFALCRVVWDGQVYRGRDPRNAAAAAPGIFSGRRYDESGNGPGTSVVAPDSSGALLDQAKYNVVSAVNQKGNDVYLGFPAESNIGISVPCIHQLAIRLYSSDTDTGVGVMPGNGIGIRGVICIHKRPTTQVGPIGRFMGAEAGAVWRHVWPADYYDTSGNPKTVVGNNIDIQGGSLEKSTEVVNIVLTVADTWPGIPTDPAARATAIASNNDLFSRQYAGPLLLKEDVAAERWVQTIVTALAGAVEVFTKDVEDVADQRR